MIAAATKSLPQKVQWKEADEMARADLEEKAEFLGLIVMQNSIKEETYPAIKELHDADIITVMVTGKFSISMKTQDMVFLVQIGMISKSKYLHILR